MFEIKVNVQLSATPDLIQAIMIIAGIAGKPVAPVRETPDLRNKVVITPAIPEVTSAVTPPDESAEQEEQGSQESEALPPLATGRLYTEAELMAYPVDVLTAFLKGSLGIDPSKQPGKNTNAKLRKLVLDAITGGDQSPEEETSGPGNVAPEASQDISEGVKITAESLRGLMVPRIQNKETKVSALNALKATGYSSITDLCEANDAEKMQELHGALVAIKVN